MTRRLFTVPAVLAALFTALAAQAKAQEEPPTSTLVVRPAKEPVPA